MGMGMSVVPGRKIRLHLGLMRCLRMRMVHRMMLVLLTVPVLIRAVHGPGLRGTWGNQAGDQVCVVVT
jgi:hypothetical protein